MDTLSQMLEDYRNGERGLPSYDELCNLLASHKTSLENTCGALEYYADSYEMMGRIGEDGKVECSSVAIDIRLNMVGAVRYILGK